MLESQTSDMLLILEVLTTSINPWPGNSPNLNPIENLKGKIQSELQNYNVSSVPKLKGAIQQLWDSMPQTYLQTAADSPPKQLKIIKNANKEHSSPTSCELS